MLGAENTALQASTFNISYPCKNYHTALEGNSWSVSFLWLQIPKLRRSPAGQKQRGERGASSSKLYHSGTKLQQAQCKYVAILQKQIQSPNYNGLIVNELNTVRDMPCHIVNATMQHQQHGVYNVSSVEIFQSTVQNKTGLTLKCLP